MGIRKKLKLYYQDIKCGAFRKIKKSRKMYQNRAADYSEIRDYTQKNKSIEIKDISVISVHTAQEYNWVGGAADQNYIYGIPSGARVLLRYDYNSGSCSYIGNLAPDPFKWTGGCIYDGCLYGMPRASDCLLKYDIQRDQLDTIDMGFHYAGEHHYGGAMTQSGVIYQPPRDTGHLLKINLNNMQFSRINLAPDFAGCRLRYCCSVLHPNGFIYFLPERMGRVIAFHPVTEEMYYLGKRISPMTFGAAISNTGIVYGFSASESGIFKMNPETGEAVMICKEIGIPGCYGSKLGINGKIYGIPGDADKIYEFDPESETVRMLEGPVGKGNGKCAGGIILKNGDMVAVPAMGNKIYRYNFGNSFGDIPSSLYQSSYYTDCY